MLFVVAWLSDRDRTLLKHPKLRGFIYALSIGVYCSSWTFLGAVGQAVDNGWHFLPIYLAPILLFLLGWRFIRKLLIVSSRNKITSIADFIGSRYGKNQLLAAIITIVLVVGTLPYIALQLRAVGIVWSWVDLSSINTNFNYASSLIAAMVMALFAILFGTRIIDGPDRLRGMIIAIATESVVKIIAFISVAIISLSVLANAEWNVDLSNLNFKAQQINSPLFATEMLLAASAMICLPRQFHVMVVEYQQENDLRYLRWLTPLYLAAFAILVAPIAYAGTALFSSESFSPDSYVLAIPAWLNKNAVLYLTIIGSLSAATGMVVVSSIALSIMISNELVVPLWLKQRTRKKIHHHLEGIKNDEKSIEGTNLARSLKLIRRFSIVVILLLGWALERIMSNVDGLASMGLISFAASAQLLPAIIGALYWQKGHSKGVVSGLLAGTAFWFYCLLLPVLLDSSHPLLINGPLQISWLSPHNFLGMGWLDPLSHGVFWSLLVNTLVMFFVSRKTIFSKLDTRQAAAFMHNPWHARRSRLNLDPSGSEVRQLQSLMEPLFGVERTLEMWREFEQKTGHRLLPHDQAPRFAVNAIERDFAAIIGAVSARKAIELLTSHQPLNLQDFVSLVGGTSKQIQFSQTLLQTTLETIPQGISVVDENLKLVAWNQQYQNLFDYPPRMLYVGCDIEKIYQFNATRGYLQSPGDDMDQAIVRRLDQLRSGAPHRLERILPSGKVIEIRGTPLVNGGYVTTYTDITDNYNMMQELAEAKLSLEERVYIRTEELRTANESLLKENRTRARLEKKLKEANTSKSRFLTAVGHDLLQPINAARLFVASLDVATTNNTIKKEDNTQNLIGIIENLDSTLDQTEKLISSLQEISRLGAGKETPAIKPFSLDSLLKPLAEEGVALANKKQLNFKYVETSVWVNSDLHLLRRVLQNFISNALFYTTSGKIVVGCRRIKDAVLIEIWDSGPGIQESDRKRIFMEFERLSHSTIGNQGLGLGLSICQHISRLLNHPISVDSTIGKGSVFRIQVPTCDKQKIESEPVIVDPQLNNLNILCIDNDQPNLAGMQALLTQWGCRAITVQSLGEALSLWPYQTAPDIVLADYHLDDETGLDVLEALRYHWGEQLPAIVISADRSDEISSAVQSAGYLFLSKPVKPSALRLFIRRSIPDEKTF